MAVRRAWAQPALLTFLVAAVGWTMGTLELTQALMTTAGGRFETQSSARASAFLVAFGLSKAAGNFVAGWLADRAGRKPTMALGWAAGAAVPPLLYFARSWGVVVSTDIFLGLNQALCWATGIFALLDLLGPSRRALAVGLLEAAGYSAIAISRPVVTAVGGCSVEARERFALGGTLGLTLACGVISLCCLRETKAPVRPGGGAIADTIGLATDDSAACTSLGSPSLGRPSLGGPNPAPQPGTAPMAPAQAAEANALGRLRRRRDLRRPDPALRSARLALAAACFAGCVLNFGTAYAWGAMTRWLTARECSGGGCTPASGCGGGSGSLAAHVLLGYSLLKGLGQLPAGAAADRRLFLGGGSWSYVVAGLGLIACAFAGLAVVVAVDAAETTAGDAPLSSGTLAGAVALTALLGLGTALAYANLQACAAALAPADRRASAIGLVRCVRDLGYAVGGIVLGSASDLLHQPWVAPFIGAVAAAVAAVLFEGARGCAAAAEKAYGPCGIHSVAGSVARARVANEGGAEAAGVAMHTLKQGGQRGAGGSGASGDEEFARAGAPGAAADYAVASAAGEREADSDRHLPVRV